MTRKHKHVPKDEMCPLLHEQAEYKKGYTPVKSFPCFLGFSHVALHFNTEM